MAAQARTEAKYSGEGEGEGGVGSRIESWDHNEILKLGVQGEL